MYYNIYIYILFTGDLFRLLQGPLPASTLLGWQQMMSQNYSKFTGLHSSYSAIVCIPRLDANWPLQLDLRQAHTRTCWFVLQLVKQVPPFVNLALNILFKHQKGCNLSFVSRESWPSCFHMFSTSYRRWKSWTYHVPHCVYAMQFVTNTTKAKDNNNFTPAFAPPKRLPMIRKTRVHVQHPREKKKTS